MKFFLGECGLAAALEAAALVSPETLPLGRLLSVYGAITILDIADPCMLVYYP
jgi:hypothetical protein